VRTSSAGSRSSAESICSCWGSAATGTWPSTSPDRRSTHAAGSPLDSRSRVVALSAVTRHDNAAYVDPVPTHAITQGLGTILEAGHLVLLALGAAKAEAVAAALTGPVTPDCPASVVQRHPHVTVVLDAAAASVLDGWGSVDRTERERVHHPQL
jgi:hypothetical protein